MAEEHDIKERWAPIPGYDGIYEASTLGRIRGVDRVETCKNGLSRRRMGLILSQRIDSMGYPSVQLSKAGTTNVRRVHTLVLAALSGRPERGDVTRHLDGNKENNRLENLRRGTQAENIRDAVRHGTLQDPPLHVGVKQWCAKLTPTAVREIRAFSYAGETTRVLARRFGVSPSTIQRVLSGKCWAHVRSFRVICSWCGKDEGPSTTESGDSHGLCAGCRAEELASLDRWLKLAGVRK